MKKFLNKIELKNAFVLLISGYLYGDGDLDEALDYLEETLNDYKDEIKKQEAEIEKDN